MHEWSEGVRHVTASIVSRVKKNFYLSGHWSIEENSTVFLDQWSVGVKNIPMLVVSWSNQWDIDLSKNYY